MANHRGPIPAWLTMPYLEKVLSDSLKLPELKLKTMDITAGSKEGDNYACQILRIATVYVSNGEEHKLSLIGKCMIFTKLMDMMEESAMFFDVEAAFYETLAPKISEITGASDSIGPKLYYVDRENKIMYMEDLVVNGYTLQARQKFLNLEQCYLTIDALATIHGCSYKLLLENPEFKTIFKKYFWCRDLNEVVASLFTNGEKAVRANLDKYGLSPEMENKLLGVFERINREGLEVCELQDGKLNFLLHGDCWKSNMMYRFNGNNPESVKLLDFQIVNYNSFANDLQYFLFTSVETNTLLENVDNILKRYYEKLISVEPNVPGLTFERVKSEFKERSFFGVAMAVVFRSFFFTENPPDLENTFDGKADEMGYADPQFIAECKLILNYFDKIGAI